MKKPSASLAALRRRSEHLLKEQHAENGENEIRNNTQRLFHELQVHQIELELQNEELNNANSTANAALEKYTELYDFAPVGYFSLDEKGEMMEMNLAGAEMLGVERANLMGRRFQLFLEPRSRAAFQEFQERMLSGYGRHSCEVELLRETPESLWVEITGKSRPIASKAQHYSRIGVSDISARKLAEKQNQRIGILAALNRDLEREIAERRVAEAALKKSEKRFRALLDQSGLLEKRVRRMAHEVLKVQEDQRKKISRELHDEISQILLGINVQLTLFSRISATNPQAVRKGIGPLRRVVAKAVNVVHRFARELRPAMLDDLGLIPTLRSHIESIPKRAGRIIRFKADARVEALDNDRRTVLYRIAQEALTNVIKHSGATIVEVHILKGEGCASLKITDNGRSFDVARIATSRWQNRLGITGMRERVEMIGGRFTVESVLGKGTMVRAEVPFPPPPIEKQPREKQDK